MSDCINLFNVFYGAADTCTGLAFTTVQEVAVFIKAHPQD
jgi:predicted GH43/DUF377 family glycosyl hydrolase